MLKFFNNNLYVNASIIYIIANGIGQGTTLLSNIFFTRYMSQVDYGLYSNYYSYVALLVPFVGMNLYCGLSNAYIDYKNEINSFRSSVLLLSIIGAVCTVVGVFFLKLVVDISVSWFVIILAIAHAYGFFVVNYYIQSMNMENRFIAKGVMLAVPNVLQAAIAGAFVLSANTYIYRAIGSGIGIVLCGLVGAIFIIKQSIPFINLEYWKYALRISLPAIFGSVAAMIMQQCDKVMITHIVGAENTAVYALIFNIGYILYAVQQATNGVWQVWLYNALSKDLYHAIPIVQKWYLYFMFILGTVLYMVAPEIIKILSPANYWFFDYVAPFVVGSYVMLMYSMEITIIEYDKKTHITSSIVTVAAVLNVLLNYFAITYFGGLGAAYTSLISYMFILLICDWYLIRQERNYFSRKYFLWSGGFIVLLGGVFNMVCNNIMGRYIIFMMILIFEISYFYIKKDEFRMLIWRDKDEY